jgi:hypothetical protein
MSGLSEMAVERCNRHIFLHEVMIYGGSTGLCINIVTYHSSLQLVQCRCSCFRL